MTRIKSVTHQFVEYIPEELSDGTIYVSIPFATAAHRCCCGCGRKVVTPITPTDWRLIFDGDTISLDPSIGSWSLPCQSHYWIVRNKVRWSGRWSKERVEAARVHDLELKDLHFSQDQAAQSVAETIEAGLWERLLGRSKKRRKRLPFG